MNRLIQVGCAIACIAMLTGGCGKKSASPTAPTSPSDSSTGGGGGGGSIPTVQTITIGGDSGGGALNVGASRQLRASARLTDGQEHDITLLAAWATDDANLVSVTSSGLVTAKKAGMGRIRATYGPTTGTTSFQIQEADSGDDPDTGGTLPPPPAPPSPGPGPGVPPAPTPTPTPAPTPTPTPTPIPTPTPTPTPIPTPTPEPIPPPLPVPVPPGPTPPVPVPPTVPNVPTVTSLRIEGANTVPIGRTAQLKAVATMSDGSEQDVTADTDWRSSNNLLAAISQSGLLSGLLPGTNVVSAEYNGQQAQRPVTVTPF